jgi:dUTP pyrophosphatase
MNKIRGFEAVKDSVMVWPGKPQLPTCATHYSAAYDFYSPCDWFIKPKTIDMVWTDVKAYMQNYEVLMMFVRSSIGIKKGLTLANGTGIIDADYYSNPDNDGNIGICLYNRTQDTVFIEKGERIAQGIFMPFLRADSGNLDAVRVGGIGSS